MESSLASVPRYRNTMVRNPGMTVTTTTVNEYKNAPTVTSSTTNFVDVWQLEVGMEMWDYKTPHFRKRQAAGEIINNPMSANERHVKFHPYTGQTYQMTVDNIGPLPNGSLIKTSIFVTNLVPDPRSFTSSPPLVSVRASAANAVNTAYAKAHQRYLNILTDVGEAKQTGALIKSQLATLDRKLNNAMNDKQAQKAAKALLAYESGVPNVGLALRRNSARAIKAGKIFIPQAISSKARAIQMAMSVSRDVIGGWLSFRYGVQPLLSSVTGLVDVLVKQTRPERETFRGFIRDAGQKEIIQPVDYGVPGLTAALTTTAYSEVNVRAGVLTAFHPTAQGQSGALLRDLPRTLYDFIPLSFVVDWAFDLGTYIEAATPLPGFSTLATWVTSRQKDEVSYKWTSSSATKNNAGRTEKWFPQSCSVEIITISKQRTVGVTPSTPAFDANLRSTTHLLDSIGLLFQKFAGLKVK